MECKNCGYKLKKGQNKCPQCGTLFDVKKEKLKKTAAVAGTTAALAGTAATFQNAAEVGKELKIEWENGLRLLDASKYKEAIPKKISTIYDTIVANTNVSECKDNTNYEEIRDVLINDRKPDIDIVNTTLDSESMKDYEVSIMNQLKDKGISEDKITRILSAYREGNQNKIYDILNEGIKIETLNTEDEIRKSLTNYGISDSDLDKVLKLSQEQANAEIEEYLSKLSEEYVKAYDNTMIEGLKSQGLKEEDAIRVWNAYKVGGEDEANSLLSELASDYVPQTEEELRDTLSQYGFNEEEIGKVIAASNKGGQEEANKVFAEINQEHAQMFEDAMTEELKADGFSDEEAARFMEAYKTGDQEKINDVLLKISNEHAAKSEQEMIKTLAGYGFSEEEVDRVIDASKISDDEANKVFAEIANEHPKLQKQIITEELRNQGLSDSEISQVLAAYKDGGEDKVIEVLNSIAANRAAAAEESMRQSLISGGLTEDEANRVIEASKTGGEAASQSVLNDINADKMESQLIAEGVDKETRDQIVTTIRNGDQETANRIYREVTEEKLISELREQGVDEETISDLVEAYRNDDEDAMSTIYEKINEKKIQDLEKELRSQGISEHYVKELSNAYRVGDQKRVEQIYATIRREQTEKAAAGFLYKLRQNGITNEEFLAKVNKAYIYGDQEELDRLMAEYENLIPITKGEQELLAELERAGITDREMISDALNAYRNNNQEALNSLVDEYGISLPKNSEEKGGIDIPDSMYIEFLLSQLGGGYLRGNNIYTTSARVGNVEVEYGETLQSCLSSIMQELASGNFSQYDKEGVNKFISPRFTGDISQESFDNLISNYYKFIDTLKMDLLLLRDVLIQMMQSEENYYNSVNREIAISMITADENSFINILNNLGINAIDRNGDGIFSVDENTATPEKFASALSLDLVEYYDDTVYEDSKLMVNDETTAEEYRSRVANYENEASLIAYLIGQASINGLIDLDAAYNVELREKLGNFTEAQFLEQCTEMRNGERHVILEYPKLGEDGKQDNYSELLATFVFQNEWKTRHDTEVSTQRYEMFLNDAVAAAEKVNYNLETSEFAYTILRMGAMNEAWDINENWRLSSYSQQGKDAKYKYYSEREHYNYPNYDDYLESKDYGHLRSETGEKVVDAFYRIVTYGDTDDLGANSARRLERSREYGSNFEEAFWLSYEYYDVVMPEFNSSNEDLAAFFSGAGNIIRISDLPKEERTVIINRINELYPGLFDKDGNLNSEIGIDSLDSLPSEGKDLMERTITLAILQARFSLAYDKYEPLVSQMHAFQTFVASEYEYDSENKTYIYEPGSYQEQGVNIYLGIANRDYTLGDCLKKRLVTYKDFVKNEDLMASYEGSYAAYCSAQAQSTGYGEGTQYDAVRDYFLAKIAAKHKYEPITGVERGEEYNSLYNEFNDDTVMLISDAEYVVHNCYELRLKFEENAFQFAESEKSKNTSLYFLYALLGCLVEVYAVGRYVVTGETKSYRFEALNNSINYTFLEKYFREAKGYTNDEFHKLDEQNIYFTTALSYYENNKNAALAYFGQFDIRDEYDAEGVLIGHVIIDSDGKRAELSDEEEAFVLLLKQREGHFIDWIVVSKDVKDYAQNISYLRSDYFEFDYDVLLGKMAFSWYSDHNSNDPNANAFLNDMESYSALGFDIEARRRAEVYSTDIVAKAWNSTLGKIFGEVSDNKSLLYVPIVKDLVTIEYCTKDIILPVLHGIVSFLKSMYYAVIDTGKMAIDLFTGTLDFLDLVTDTHLTANSDYSVSLNDLTWQYVIQNYKESGGFDYTHYYVTQAMICVGNQVIPIVVGRLTNTDWAALALLGASAYGNTLHTTLGEFVQYYNPKTDEWAEGKEPWNAFLYACLDAASEMFLERFVGGVTGLSKAARILPELALKDIVKEFGKDMLKEMIEESLQEFINPLLKDIGTLDIARQIKEEGFGGYVSDYLENKVNYQAVLDAAIIAMISSGVLNGVQRGPGIQKALTQGEAYRLSIYNEIQARYMAQQGYTNAQIQAQLMLNNQMALSDPAKLNQIMNDFLSDPKFQQEFKNWKKQQQGKKSDYKNFSIEDYAYMRAVQSMSFDTTELETQLGRNNNRINELTEKLTDSGFLTELYRSHGHGDVTSILNEINELNLQNTEISKQIESYRAKAKATINTNNETISNLQNQLTELQTQLETCTEEERAKINKQIEEVKLQIENSKLQNSIIELSLTDNITALESQIKQNEKILVQIKEQVNNDQLGQNIIEQLNEQITIRENQQTDLNNRLNTSNQYLANTLANYEAQLIMELELLNTINRTDTENMTPTEIENYKKLQEQINKIQSELDDVQNKLKDLEDNGFKAERRITSEDVRRNNEENNRIVEEIIEERISAQEERKSQHDGQSETTEQDATDQSRAPITVNEDTRASFTKNMTLILAPLLMRLGFTTNNMITTDGTIVQYYGPSCGRLLDLLKTRNNELTEQYENTSETETDTRADIQSQIDSNNDAIGSLTALMSQFSIGENSPLTALIEQMQLNKMQLEEIRNANNGQEITEYVSYNDAVQELKWSFDSIMKSDLTNLEKYKALKAILDDVISQSGNTILNYAVLELDTIDVINIDGGMSVNDILNYYQLVNIENIQSIFDEDISNYEKARKLIEIYNNLNISYESFKKINIEGLVIDGKQVSSLNLGEFIAEQLEIQSQLEYDIVRSEFGHYDRSRRIDLLRGLNVEETPDFLKLSDMLRSVKESRTSDSNTIDGLRDLVSKYSYMLANTETKSKFLANPTSLTDMEVLELATNLAGRFKMKMIESGVGLLETTTTKDGKVTINVYGTDTRLGEVLKARFESLYERMPDIAKVGLNRVNLYTEFDNPANDYWAVVYNHDIRSHFLSAATGGNGVINFWDLRKSPESLAFSVLCHESGHNIDGMIANYLHGKLGFWTELTSEWQNAKNADGNRVTAYGEKALVEDFAESYMQFVLTPRRFAMLHPHRVAVLSQVLAQLSQELSARNILTTNQSDVQANAPAIASHHGSSNDIGRIGTNTGNVVVTSNCDIMAKLGAIVSSLQSKTSKTSAEQAFIDRFNNLTKEQQDSLIVLSKYYQSCKNSILNHTQTNLDQIRTVAFLDAILSNNFARQSEYLSVLLDSNFYLMTEAGLQVKWDMVPNGGKDISKALSRVLFEIIDPGNYFNNIKIESKDGKIVRLNVGSVATLDSQGRIVLNGRVNADGTIDSGTIYIERLHVGQKLAILSYDNGGTPGRYYVDLAQFGPNPIVNGKLTPAIEQRIREGVAVDLQKELLSEILVIEVTETSNDLIAIYSKNAPAFASKGGIIQMQVVSPITDGQIILEYKQYGPANWGERNTLTIEQMQKQGARFKALVDNRVFKNFSYLVEQEVSFLVKEGTAKGLDVSSIINDVINKLAKLEKSNIGIEEVNSLLKYGMHIDEIFAIYDKLNITDIRKIELIYDFFRSTGITLEQHIDNLLAIRQRVTNEINNVLNTEGASIREIIKVIGKYSVEEIEALLHNNKAISTDTMLGRVLQLGMQFYEEGHKTAETKYKEFYENFRDHGFQHALAVTKYAEKLISIGCNVDIETVLFAALMHDLGMTGESGTQGYVSLTGKVRESVIKALCKDLSTTQTTNTRIKSIENGIKTEITTIVTQEQLESIQKFFETKKAATIDELRKLLSFKVKRRTTKSNADTREIISQTDFVEEEFINNNDFSNDVARSQHPLNSAMYIMEYFFNELGGEKATRIAILAMSHSKSTSGIKSFISLEQWEGCITTLEEVLEERFGKESTEYQERYKELEKLRKEIQNPEFREKLINEAFLVREGDAMSEVILFGDKILMQNETFGVLGDIIKRIISPESYRIATSLFEEMSEVKEERIGDALNNLVKNFYSKGIHFGEVNTIYDSSVTTNSKGNFDIYKGWVILQNALLFPLATWDCSIKERLGELNTYTNMGEREFTIWLPSNSPSELIEFYKKAIKKWVAKQKIDNVKNGLPADVIAKQNDFYDNIRVELMSEELYYAPGLSLQEKINIQEKYQQLIREGISINSIIEVTKQFGDVSVEHARQLIRNMEETGNNLATESNNTTEVVPPYMSFGMNETIDKLNDILSRHGSLTEGAISEISELSEIERMIIGQKILSMYSQEGLSMKMQSLSYEGLVNLFDIIDINEFSGEVLSDIFKGLEQGEIVSLATRITDNQKLEQALKYVFLSADDRLIVDIIRSDSSDIVVRGKNVPLESVIEYALSFSKAFTHKNSINGLSEFETILAVNKLLKRVYKNGLFITGISEEQLIHKGVLPLFSYEIEGLRTADILINDRARNTRTILGAIQYLSNFPIETAMKYIRALKKMMKFADDYGIVLPNNGAMYNLAMQLRDSYQNSILSETARRLYFGNNRGVNQGIIKGIMKYGESWRRAQLIEQVQRKYPGISAKQAYKFLSTIDTKYGVCNYADFANAIAEYFVNHPEISFEERFGFPLFINIDGMEVLNAPQLLLDIYMEITGDLFVKSGGSLYEFFTGSAFKSASSNEGYLNLNNYIGENNKYRLDLLNKYLNNRGFNIGTNEWLVQKTIFNSRKAIVYNSNGLNNKANVKSYNILTRDYVISMISEELAKGRHLSIGTVKGAEMIAQDGSKIVVGEGHVMTILGVMKDGKIFVNSWGSVYAIEIGKLLEDKILFTIDEIHIE